MKKESIVRYTLEEIRERRRKGLSKTDWDLINSMTEEDIERLALEDNKRHGIDDDWYKGAVWVNGIEERLALDKRDQERNSKSEA